MYIDITIISIETKVKRWILLVHYHMSLKVLYINRLCKYKKYLKHEENNSTSPPMFLESTTVHERKPQLEIHAVALKIDF